MKDQELQVDILTSREEIEAVREHWERFQWHPNTDFDIYQTVVDARPEIIEPCVFIFRDSASDGQPVAMVVGRKERNPLNMRFGYKTLFKPTLTTISILYGGMLGESSPRVIRALTTAIWDSLNAGDAEIAAFKFLDTNSAIWPEIRSSIPGRCRDISGTEMLHWRIAIPEDTAPYFRKFKKIRKKTRNPEKNFPGQVLYQCLSKPEEVDWIGETCAHISAGTYHEGLGVAFTNDDEHRAQLRLWAERGVLRTYMLSLGGTPCAYYIGFCYGDTFHFMSTGFDEQFRGESPGTYLLMYLIRDIIEQTGMKNIDFGFGDAFYKRRFGNEQWMEKTAHIFAPSFKGVMLNGVNSAIVTVSDTTRQIMQWLHVEQRIKKLWRRRLTKTSE